MKHHLMKRCILPLSKFGKEKISRGEKTWSKKVKFDLNNNKGTKSFSYAMKWPTKKEKDNPKIFLKKKIKAHYYMVTLIIVQQRNFPLIDNWSLIFFKKISSTGRTIIIFAHATSRKKKEFHGAFESHHTSRKNKWDHPNKCTYMGGKIKVRFR